MEPNAPQVREAGFFWVPEAACGSFRDDKRARLYTTIITGFSISVRNAPMSSAPSAPSTAR
jgi:hypothetical protein